MPIPQTIKAGLLFRPVGGVLASGIVTTDAYNATAQTFTNSNLVLWNSGLFNTQGETWEAVNGGDPTQGVRNAASSRTSGGTRYNHVTSFEFHYTGGAFDIAFIGTSYYDCQVYIESGGQMYKAQVDPISGTTSGAMNRRIVFGAQYTGRIRVHLGGGTFVGIRTEQSAIIKPTPNRPFSICDGAGSADGAGLKQASGPSFLTNGLADFLFEKTGIVWSRRGQALTSYFRNSTATVTDDTAASDNSTRWFSSDRKTWVAADLAAKPIFYLIVGGREDGGVSGATGVDGGAMYTRAKACYDWIRSQDSLVQIVQVSPAPFTGAGAAGTTTGPPTAGDPHDLNRQEQNIAVSKTARTSRINSYGPTTPWWTGAGNVTDGPATSQQSVIIGPDKANFNQTGVNFYAAKIAADLGTFLVNMARGRGQK